MKSKFRISLTSPIIFLLVKTTFISQGTTFLSNLDTPTIGNLPVASDTWVSTWFQTGPSPAGYTLNSIQLSFGNDTGNPSGISVMIWDFRNRQSLANLSGSDPFSFGVYTYTASDFNLLPSTVYWFAVKSSTTAEIGSFQWNYSAPGGFIPGLDLWSGGSYPTSSDGVVWDRGNSVGKLQFAVNATAIPEPSSLVLLGLGGSFLFTRLARKSRSKALTQQ